MTDPRGRWFRVYARQVRQHSKFRDLNVTQLGAWLVLRSEAELRDRACFADRADAVLTLRRRKTPSPAGMLDGMLALSLFDLQEDGSITVHDRDDHDRQKYPSDDPDETRRRKAEQRERDTSRDTSREGHESDGNESRDSHDTRARGQPQPTALSTQPTASQPPELRLVEEEGNDLKDGADAYFAVTGRFPSDRVLEWLNRLTRLYTDELFGKVLAKTYLEDSDPRTLLSRTEDRLKALHYRQHRTEIKAEARKVDADALAEVKRQHELDWEQCSRCGIRRGAHRADHEFEVA